MVRAIALISFVYDVGVGLALLLAAPAVAGFFRIPQPTPAVLADTNGLLLIGIGLGYVLPLRDPERWRAYLWLMGPWLKGAGAVVFLRDALFRASPASFLLFALADGTLAVLTLIALVRSRRLKGPAAAPARGGSDRTGRAESPPG
jgi:hypothetical protein